MDHIPEQEMYDLVDGELTAEDSDRILAHLSVCKRCSEIFSEIVAVEGGIRNLWDNHLSKSCPDEDTLFAYFEGSIKGEDVESIEKHLENCPLCRASLRIAEDSRERTVELERAVEETVPSIINRLKQRLEDVDLKNLMDEFSKFLIPSRIGNELFDFLSKSARVLKYSLASPVEAPVLMPAEAGGIKLADTGKGFIREIQTEPGTPFEIEWVQFGDRMILNFRSLDAEHREAILKYSLSEAGTLKGQRVVLISEGKGSVTFSEDEIDALRPDKSPLTLKLEEILKGDMISNVDAGGIIELAENLRRLLLSEDPDIPDLALDALKKLEEFIPEDA